ncbi:AAC(3) family N-acetyltransferase [Candidatus Sumerlaeota bacterium]|nr:AAC(3) family N-acetyltransferase [Candidatus Sumerlaeota bacterium]
MGVAKKDIIQGLRRLSIKEGDILLVHSSLRSFGHVEGGADTVIDALLEVVGEDGTVMVPTITGKREHNKDNPPVFDVLRTPCWTGKIPETFRKRPTAQRSLHPTHSVSAIGRNAHLLLDEHIHSYTPCDEKSPYQKNAEHKGKILFIGVTQECNTTLHACEEIANVPYHLQAEETRCIVIDPEGVSHTVVNRLHSWEGPERNFPVVDELLLAKGLLKRTQVGQSTLAVMPAQELIAIVLEKLRQDPYFLCKK